ncbi:unnamed protein product [Mucor hiemalis]
MLDIEKKIRLPSNKPNFEYFNNNAPRSWDYESFKKYKTVQAVHPPRNKRIRANYEEAIKDIRNLSCVNGEMKDYLDSLIKDTNSESDKGEKQMINQYINYGNVGNQGPSEIGNINININSTKKRKYNDEEDHNSNNRSDDNYHLGVDDSSQLELSSPSPEAAIQLEEFDSFITDETDHTYQTEDSKHHAETLTTRKYIMTLQEVDICEANEKEELIYDNNSSLYERLAISSINYNVGLSEVYELPPTMLDDQEYSKIKEWRMILKKNQLYYPPIATTPSQLHLNTFLCNMADTIINDKQVPGKKSEIGFTVDNVSPLFKYLFPANGVLSYKWSVSTFEQ